MVVYLWNFKSHPFQQTTAQSVSCFSGKVICSKLQNHYFLFLLGNYSFGPICEIVSSMFQNATVSYLTVIFMHSR
ncbi:hypothetical protein SORBI_3001G253800 [Sorghum bicolor]|uniref:Uncharacterized protein n=1 Tax=Sorghum bicolor TaxID=4558 RepID=A0A1B6QKX6_SORBI|nr:hypothetical protein SORBI_3001G253800 [Sorghum bicolor]